MSVPSDFVMNPNPFPPAVRMLSRLLPRSIKTSSRGFVSFRFEHNILVRPSAPLASFRQFSTEGKASTDSQQETGTVKWFDSAKGFGFITKSDGTDLFAHFSHIQADGFKVLEEGQKVAFSIAQGPKGPYASAITVTDSSGAQPRRRTTRQNPTPTPTN